MSAESATTELTFSVTCGLLEVSLTAANDETTKDVKTIEIVGIPTDSTLTIYTLTCAQAQDISSAKTFYIALPAGSYTVMKFTNSTGHICSRPATAAMALAANTIEPRTVSGIKFNDILSGNFSVSSTAKVRFAKGNLYYNGSAFKFEDNQYSSATSRSDASHISHFYWSKNASVAYASAYSDGSRAASDVIFTNATATTPKSDFTVNGETGVWRTLSGTDSGEWVYLLLTRTVNGGTGIGNSYRMATIRSDVSGGVLGMLIYPDNYTAQTTATSYTSDEWATMESAGCVFLPATGCWTGNVYTPKNTVIDVGKTGYYWTSLVAAAENAFRHLFESNRFEYPTGCSFRSTGHSLRLVCDVQ